jgi:hypothetical protein
MLGCLLVFPMLRLYDVDVVWATVLVTDGKWIPRSHVAISKFAWNMVVA